MYAAPALYNRASAALEGHRISRKGLSCNSGAAAMRASIRPGFISSSARTPRLNKLLGGGVGFGVRKGDKALKDALNQALKDLKSDGTIDRFAAKYFDVKVVLK
jgi:ABC-type amino acid transport substrate-binding protein